MNVWKMGGKFSLFNDFYIFIDSKEKLANNIFKKNNLQVKTLARYASDDVNYKNYEAVFCKVKKRDASLFAKCIKQLHDDMIICGYYDYEDTVKMVEQMCS